MSMNMVIVIILALGVALTAFLMYLQYRLCCMEKHWYGLILPMMSLVFAVNGFMTLFNSEVVAMDVAVIYWTLPVILMTMIYVYVRFLKKK
ncbi:MAG: hypothetical protein IJO78_05690 [Erysipelotrichaceae bacterium]|nr:hypothetical protein [Erysipelotrichaceae bacterium]